MKYLKKHVAQLVYMDEFDVYAKGFDNLVYGIEVLKCQKKNYSKQQEQKGVIAPKIDASRY